MKVNRIDELEKFKKSIWSILLKKFDLIVNDIEKLRTHIDTTRHHYTKVDQFKNLINYILNELEELEKRVQKRVIDMADYISSYTAVD